MTDGLSMIAVRAEDFSCGPVEMSKRELLAGRMRASAPGGGAIVASIVEADDSVASRRAIRVAVGGAPRYVRLFVSLAGLSDAGEALRVSIVCRSLHDALESSVVPVELIERDVWTTYDTPRTSLDIHRHWIRCEFSLPRSEPGRTLGLFWQFSGAIDLCLDRIEVTTGPATPVVVRRA